MFHIQPSIQTIARHIEMAGISLKRAVPLPAPWNSVDTIQQRIDFASTFPTKADDRTVIFIDETNFNLSRHQSRGRELKGKTPLIPIPNFRTKTLIAAVSTSKIVHHQFVRHIAKDFQTFLINLPLKPDTRDALLIFDHVSIHGDVQIQQTLRHLKATYGIDALFLPSTLLFSIQSSITLSC